MSDHEGGGFGDRLRQHRSAAGLTQEELADRSGLSVRTIANMEHGRTTRPYGASVQSLADALDLHDWEREQLAQAGRPCPVKTAALPAELPSGLAANVTGPTAAVTGPSAMVPRQLPAAVPHFVGRTAELKALTSLLDAPADNGRTVVISAIAGTAGVGKTTLAVRWAHQVADRFPDGQLYVNLRGFDPSGDPVSPAEAIRGFLDAVGVPAGQLPATAQAQAGLYRSLLASRCMLIVADNARDAAQVRPLLPGNPACLVIVTSRSQLTGLVAADGASPLALDVLTDAESADLLARRLGPDRLAREPQATEQVIMLCARLPLALAIVAARAAVSAALTLGELAAELRAATGRLDALDTGEAATSFRAVFSWSYQDLSSPAARLFRLLGIHPGPDITAFAAASLAGLPVSQSRQLLRELARCHLATEHQQGRFAVHDILRAYAAEQAGVTDSEPARRAAIHRMLDHYLHTARTAALVLYPPADLGAPVPAQPGVTPVGIAGHEQAMSWFEAERRVLLAIITQANSLGFDAYACHLPSACTVFLDRRGYWDDYAATQEIALSASLRLADLTGQARAYRGIGHARTRQGCFDDASAHLRHALHLYRQLGDRTGQARAYHGLAFILERQGRYADSLEQCMRALDLYQAVGERVRQADTLNNIGWCHAQLGDHRQALVYCEQAIALYTELDDKHGAAATWDSIGYAHHQLADYSAAASDHEKAAWLFGKLGDRHPQAVTLIHLGDSHLAAGRPEHARRAWQQALVILADLRHPDAESVRANLRKIDALAVHGGP
jgi:tetratricopeptide (TPR) repeat protein/transcriptional regulator with XRE-family HTH domain